MSEETEALLEQIAEMLKPVVAHIEAQPKLTMARYDLYMSAIAACAENTGLVEHGSCGYQLLGTAFIRAGANRRGVESALMVMGHR